VDADIKKDWTLKGGKVASLTLSVNDNFPTGNRTQAYYAYFFRYAERYRKPHLSRSCFETNREYG